MRNFSLKIVFLVIFLLTLKISAQLPSATPRPPRQTPAEKRQQLEQEASTAMSEVDTAYREILSYVNAAEAPSDTKLRDFNRIISKNRKYLPVISDSQKGVYHIFSAWVYYFDNKQDKAVKQVASAQKVSSENPNTAKTNFALAILDKDYVSLMTPLPKQSTSARSIQSANMETQAYQTADQGGIQLDINSIKTELLGQPFDLHPLPVQPQFSWRSANQVTCALLWKIDANELERFAPPKPRPKTEPNIPSNEPNLPLPPEPRPFESYQQTQIPQFETFSLLPTFFENDTRIFFAGINLNNTAKIKNLENWLNRSPKPWPNYILSNSERQKMLSLLIDSNTPVLLIIAPDGTIRYAGQVEGFLPQMVISSILQNAQEFPLPDPNDPNSMPIEPNEPNEPNLPFVPPSPPGEPNITPTPMLTPEPNNLGSTSQDVPKTPQAPQTPENTIQNQNSDDDFSAEDYEATKLLENAKTFMKIGNRLQYHTYAKPIEMCRTVMKNYPNTKYAQEAQVILREVPERFRDRYNITDQELGL